MSNEPVFAIVIPTYNSESKLPHLLDSIKAQSLSSYSIAVVDQSSDDRTLEIASDYGCTVVKRPAPSFYTPPAQGRNLGAASIKGHVLLHLDADMELASTDLLATLQRLIDADHEAAIIHEVDVPVGFWPTCKALERSCYRGTAMEAARAVRRELFDRVGGYDEAISSGEDFYITRLYERETQIVQSDELWVRHHTGSSSLRVLIKKKFLYGKTAGVYLAKARSARAPSEVSIVRASLGAYFRNWRLFFSHPLHYTCIFPLRGIEFVAVHLGMWIGARARVSKVNQT